MQRILKEESHLDAVADPAGGSYYIEALTDALAREAWKLFQQVEAEGGYAKALASGSIDKALAETRAAREKAYSARRRALVGVNNYPNVTEKTPEAELPPADAASSAAAGPLAEPFEKIRRRTAEHAARDRPISQGAAAETRRRQDEGRARQLLLQFLRLRGLRHGGSRRVRRARTRT